MEAESARTLLGDACRRFAVPGAQLGLMVGDERLVVVAGTVEVGGPEPVEPSSCFHAGSLAKSLAAMTVMDAARRGEIDLDVPCAEQARGLWSDTPRALMAQVTGRPNELPSVGEDVNEFVARVGSMPRIHAPGRFSYCNAGWSVLDALLRARSGASFEVLAAERVLGRAVRFGQPASAAVGHTASPSAAPRPVRDDTARAASAAGSRWWATADELLDFASVHLRREIDATRVAEADILELRQAQAAIPGATVADAWGLGWALWDRGTHQAFGWAGLTGGHRAFLRCFPNEDAALVVLANCAGPLFGPPGGSALFDHLLPDALDLMGIPALAPPVRAPSGTPASELAGRYGPVTVESRNADDLVVHAPTFGEPNPIGYHRVGGDTFEVDHAPPGSTPIAFEAELFYLGPMAFPKTATTA